MKALVVACRSFLGAEVVKAFRSSEVEVVGTHRNLGDCSSFSLDLMDEESIRRSLQQSMPDYIIQCAAATQTADPVAMYQVHVLGCLNLLRQVSVIVPHAQVILLGSAAEYGNVPAERLPIDESYACQPSSFFGESKLAQFHMATQAAKSWKLRLAHLRPFNICGPGIPKHYFLGSLAHRIWQYRQPNAPSTGPLVIDNADATRDFIDVRDVAEALVQLCIRNVLVRGECPILNVATGTEQRIMDVARLFAEIADVEVIPRESAQVSRSGISRSCGSKDRLSNLIGWEPRRGIRESIQDQWNIVREPSMLAMSTLP
jgi:GDP-4-dehydro-6-deoxy-D-mannose reductase